MIRELFKAHKLKTAALSVSLFTAALGVLGEPPSLRSQTHETSGNTERTQYQINLQLQFEDRSYTGSERVRWINRADRPISVLYFHLYSNVRSDPQASPASGSQPSPAPDEPRLEITRVRMAGTDTSLPFAQDDQGTTLRVNLREAVSSGGTTEIEIGFKGTVPEIDSEETGLTTHVVKQVSAALRGEKEMRRARDVNFRSRGVMLLGTFHPVLAVHDGDEWRRKIEPSVGDMIFNEVADYEVTVETDPGLAVFASGTERARQTTRKESVTFGGTNLRDFAIVAGRNLRSEQAQVGNTKVRSVFIAEHERIGKRTLRIAADAARIFTTRFGPLPFETINIVEAPLVAGLGSTEFAAFNVIASAFYLDFESPSMRNLPEIIREQRPAVEQSLEWTVAHLVAHQWWGAVVGNDPTREAVLDEALSCWSALLYYRERHGEEQAASVLRDELLGVYRLYRTFGGEDMDANRPSREYRNSFQYEAIVSTKGALMFVELQRLLGEEKFFAALQSYYKANSFEIAQLDDLRGALMAETPIEQRRTVARTFNRWLASKRGDEDIARPDPELATSLGLPPKPDPQKSGDRNAFTAFARLGKFFWQQMTRIR
ncbi:MAG: M1 family metallopeptidase [Pyrinomonadaceae bacterium]